MTYDLIIIGAGPAGVSAATEASARGLSVLLLDENPTPGGRIWQALEARGGHDRDDAPGVQALRAFRASTTETRWRAGVWAVESDGTVFWSEDGSARSAQGHCLLLATGTTERPMPIPGWTLPGVMTVGAAQIALKTGGLVPAHHITNVTASVNGKVVLDAEWGGGIAKNPYLAFKVKGAKAGGKVKISWTDNTGDSISAEATIS